MGDGSLLRIEDIDVGDQVWAFDPLTGEEGPREVTDLIEGEGATTLVDITAGAPGGGAQTITATDEHPFWVPEAAEWVQAADLESGTWLRTSSGVWAQITAVDVREAPHQRVHNLTVDGLHTYYVGADGTPLLVHNDNKSGPGSACAPPAGTASRTKIKEDWEKYPEGRNSHVRPADSEAELKSLFEKWTKGGTKVNNPNYPGEMYDLPDGTRISMRGSSKSGGSTVDVKIPGEKKPIKIHLKGT